MRKMVFLGAIIIILLLGTNLLTFYFTGQDDTPKESKEGLDSAEDLAGEYEDYTLLFQVMDILKNNYIDSPDKEKLLQGAVEGMVDSLEDPQSSYLDEDALEELKLETEGVFGGIGVSVTEVDNQVTVIDVIPDTPSEEEGVERGDRIWKVDGEELEEHTLEEAVDLLRGPEGSEVKVTVKRPGTTDPVSFDITRGEIRASTVSHEWMEEGLGYVEITEFDRQTGQEFSQALKELEEEGLDGLVLDLRYNPGGLLNQALEVADILMPEGEITRLVGRDDEVLETYNASGESRSYPMAVLINEGSASGSEIVAGALQDHDKAVLIGESTFGKGTVQDIEENLETGGLRYTVYRYETPQGKDLHEDGLKPDYEVEPSRILNYYRYFIPDTLKEGDQGESVSMLQEMLQVIGYQLELTGIYDKQTVEAMQKFQQEKGLESDGVFDEVTWLRLREEIDEKVLVEDPKIQKALEKITQGD